MLTKNLHAGWTPLYFLSALGAGGMIVTFFMFLLFWVPHPDQPIPVYSDWSSFYQLASVPGQWMIAAALGGILLFTFFHLWLLVWNLIQYGQWKKADGLDRLRGTNAHTQLLALPLTLGMTINAGFINGALFVPGLWDYVEWLFPLAMSGFAMLGIWSFRLYFGFLSQTLSGECAKASGGCFDTSANNSLAQLMPGFAFAMISVGLAAPAAMSHDKVTVAVSIFLASLFMIPALFVTVVKLIIGIAHMLEHGANRSALPTLWVGVPILTTLSIAVLRLDHGMVHTLHLSETGAAPFLFLSLVIVGQLFLLLMGGAIMARMDYFRSVWKGEERTPVVFAMICPGVAFSVSLHFFINKGLVAAGLISKFGAVYWTLSGFAIAVQLITALALIGLVMQQVIVKSPEPALASA